MNDPLGIKEVESDLLCGPLHTATLCTRDIAGIRKFYVDGMGMELVGPIDLSEQQVKTQASLWDIPKDITYDYYHLHRPSVPSLIQIRVLLLHQDTAHIHQSYSSRELGPFSLGFPNANQKSLHKKLVEMDIEVMADMQTGEIPRADGTTYRYWETIFKGPDFLHCVGIERGDGMPPLSPVDESNQMGGPGYSAFVTNKSTEELSFYVDVLGLELRADRYWETSTGSALGIQEGVAYRFSLVYAPGSAQNHLLFLDYQDGIFEETGVAPRVPNIGLGMWSFQCTDLAKVLSKASAHNIKVISGPSQYQDPITGDAAYVTLLTPSGFLVEVFQTN